MTNLGLTPGKRRRLETAASPGGIFKILAVDHRRVLLKLMDPAGLGNLPPQRVTEFKFDIVRAIGPLATAVILDPQYGVKQAVECSAVPPNVALLSAVDAEAFGSHSPESESASWNVRSARQIGASGVKFYLSYHPDAGKFTATQEILVRDVIAQCGEEEMPLFLEPVLCSTDPSVPAKSSAFASQRRRAAIKTAEKLGAMGPDVLKLEFPVDCHHERDEAVWRTACAELNDASQVPWALLSAGEAFAEFKVQLQIACEAGCSGFMAGRALWGEVATTADSERPKILHELIVPRMEALNQIADRYGRSWIKKRHRDDRNARD